MSDILFYRETNGDFFLGQSNGYGENRIGAWLGMVGAEFLTSFTVEAEKEWPSILTKKGKFPSAKDVDLLMSKWSGEYFEKREEFKKDKISGHAFKLMISDPSISPEDAMVKAETFLNIAYSRIVLGFSF